MVRVFKCHSFASQKVIQVNKEPLTICTDKDRVFVATNDCEIIVYQISDGFPKEIHRCPTVSLADQVIFNAFKNCIITTELKKSWKGVTKSVRVYLNWEHSGTQGASKQRARVRVAGKSHIQHTSGAHSIKQVEIIEVPVDGNPSCIAVCNYTGNFAIASGPEVKLCSLVEKTITNSNSTFLDIEVFLELCWNFPVVSISLCEEYIVSCSQREVQVIRVRYDEREKVNTRDPRKLVKSPSISFVSNPDGSQVSSEATSPKSFASEIITFPGQQAIDTGTSKQEQIPARDISSVGMRPVGRQSPKPNLTNQFMKPVTKIVEDENFIEWSFLQNGRAGNASGEKSVCLPGLHIGSAQSQCHTHIVSPPVLSDFSGGKVKSSSGVHAETVLHLSDPRGMEEWMCAILIPSHSGTLTVPVDLTSTSNTDRMRSSCPTPRVSMSCYISGSRGGYTYQLWPQLSQVSLYKYTDLACQIGVSENFLHVVTKTGVETYTSRWGAVSVEMMDKELGTTHMARPVSSLDICLCGHEPFFGAVCLSVGTDFLALLSKVEEDTREKEAHWGLYVLHSFQLSDLYKDMLSFANRIRETGPASYIHLLQEAHLLLASHPLHTHMRDPEVREYLQQVSRLIADYFAQPEQTHWELAWPYYHSSGASVQDVVSKAVDTADKKNPQGFGRGLIDFLDHELFSQEEYINLAPKTCNAILGIYAVAAPDKLSKIILLSNAKKYSAETALRHLKTWLAVKASSAQAVSTLDRLALVQLNLQLCEVESACQELRSIQPSGLVDVCATHPALLHDGLSSFTALAQLMRQHLSSTLLESLVEMVDRGSMSLESLLVLLKSQSPTDLPHNTHIREVLELIVCSKKRELLFEDAVRLLCQAYIARAKDKTQMTYRQISALAPQKFALPQGDGHFAPRFAWLDHLPPFTDPQQMMRPCQNLEVKHVAGGSKVRQASLPVSITSRHQSSNGREECPCCLCNESLLKLQSLLCSPRTTPELAEFVLKQIGQGREPTERHHPKKVKAQDLEAASVPGDDADLFHDGENGEAGHRAGLVHNNGKTDHKDGQQDGEGGGDCWDGVRLLCLRRLDLPQAIEIVVDKYPAIAGSFGVCCFHGDEDKFTHLMRSMEAAMKSSIGSKSKTTSEEIYVKAYKDLLSRLTELLSPSKLVQILPGDVNLYFVLPYLCSSIERAHKEKLKSKIVNMGQELMKA
ncbi:hermansky-Pudlak syndrome 3 protein homolog [Plakobranchus ocellatus]|uniref:Hermansky-Pudlak syndrome 3 protein homolog n=1 Tax=Plakobranchus ocellatus TaxID=259542 RepID=A0AAV3Z6Q5_9GAST|nr:hermansky-Pudlak syndrome 3 protein homolog [Plakobranchus ocellatus]